MTIDLADRTVADPVVPIALVSPIPPRPERRVAHRYEGSAAAVDRSNVEGACVACGYPQRSHLALTDPEREMIVALVNQPKPQPLMRRSILRKLTEGWRSRHTGAAGPALRK
jgi:hypothetical protein